MKKKCRNCGELKPLSEFYKTPKGRYGVQGTCKACMLVKAKDFRLTKPGLVSTIYASQKSASVGRGHPMPTYTKSELSDWAMGQSVFHRLYYEWKVSGYDRELRPSFDRLDDYKPYTFDNLQIITWRDNKRKFTHDIKYGINNKQNMAVAQCLLSGEVLAKYYSLRSAERLTGVPHESISNVCNGKAKHSHGYVWVFTKW